MLNYRIWKKGMIFGIIVFFAMSTFSTIPSTEIITLKNNQIKVIKSDVCNSSVFLKCLSMRQLPQPISKIESFYQYQVTDKGRHPALAKDYTGTLLAAYEYHEDPQKSYVYWTYSTDCGMTWDPGVYQAVEGMYPALEYWGSGNRFFGIYGTFQTHDITFYLLECTDPSDYTTYVFYVFTLWDWINYLKDLELACDSSQGYENWGVLSFIASRQVGYLVDVPHLLGPGDELYYQPLEDCAHTSVDIDHSTFLTYALYDYFDQDEDEWRLLVWIKDFSQWDWVGEVSHLSGAGNLQFPAVDAYDDNLVILAETDESGNKDIICYYSDNGITNFKTSFVTTDEGDERFPDVQNIQDNIFCCTFIKDGMLHKKLTVDGGATWYYEGEIDECEEEYKASDMCENGARVIYERDEGIYVGDVFTGGISAPVIDGPTHGRVGIPYDYTFMSIDDNCNDLIYYINWGDDTTSETYGPSGENVTLSHTWTSEGTFVIKAKAKDIFGGESDWGTFAVTIPRDKTINKPLLQFLQFHHNLFPLLKKLLQQLGFRLIS